MYNCVQEMPRSQRLEPIESHERHMDPPKQSYALNAYAENADAADANDERAPCYASGRLYKS